MTFYDRIRQVPSSHNLVVRNNRARLSQYWSLEQIRKIHYRKDEEYVDEFCDRFAAAVACRLRTSKGVGINLSGGLDSGSVAILAAKQLKEQGQTLHAFTSVPLHDVTALVAATDCADESASARLTALAAGNTHLTTVNAQGKTPLQGITEAMEILKHPKVAVYNCFWLLSIYELMQAQGLGTVLSGQFGNATISWHGNLLNHLRSLLWRGNVSQIRREFTLLRKRKGWSYPTSIKNLIIAPLVPQLLLERRRYLAAGPRPWENHSALNPDFAKRQNLRDLMWRGGVFANSPTNPAIREVLLPVGMLSGTGVGAALAAPFGLELRDPTSDKRLIEFCFGIPESQYIYNDKKRLLIRKAMKGQLPEAVLTNEKYGSQSADLVLRIRDSHAEMAEELDIAARSPLTREYLDVPKLRAVFEAALTKLDINVTMETGGILLKGLITSKFLRSFET